MRTLVFGASSTQGYWDTQGGWADRLKHYYDALQMKDFSVEQPKVMNLGISGDTTAEILERLDPESSARQNEKGISFIFQIGTNNAAEVEGKIGFTTDQYKSDLLHLIQKARKYSDKLLIVGLPAVDELLTTPVAWSDIYFRNENIIIFEKAAQELSRQEQIPFVPIHLEYKAKMDRGTVLSSHDGLHPNDEGHKFIFELVRPKLDELLK